jgi:Mn-containing catalase
MFMHNKRLVYTVRVGAPDPILANLGDREKQAAVDGGDGLVTVTMSRAEIALAKKVVTRARSDPATDPMTGTELGQGARS